VKMKNDYAHPYLPDLMLYNAVTFAMARMADGEDKATAIRIASDFNRVSFEDTEYFVDLAEFKSQGHEGRLMLTEDTSKWSGAAQKAFKWAVLHALYLCHRKRITRIYAVLMAANAYGVPERLLKEEVELLDPNPELRRRNTTHSNYPHNRQW